jgi:hypothetical protein
MRTLVWFSGGAASAVAAKLTPNGLLVRCETGNEDPDNHRFERDVETWLQRTIQVLKSDEFDSVPDVWVKRRYMAGIAGAPCTVAMKVQPRLAFQRPTDVHVFGYTADSADVERFGRLQANYPELVVRAPLIEHGITKHGALAMIERAGIALPRTYAMGFPNANCLQSGCVKATSPAYWALYRKHFPAEFAKTAALARELGARLCRLEGERAFIDDIPLDHPTTDPIVPICDFLCVLAEMEPA